MTYEEAIKHINVVKSRIRGGDEAYDIQRKEALNIAIEALEKQIPKKVCTTTNRFNVTHYHCPRRECHAGLEYENQRCCDDCGQALDWEGIE